MRIVSLLPSATDIVVALGCGEQLVGVTHSCDLPDHLGPDAVLTHTAVPRDASSSEIDRFVREAAHAGEPLYHVDEARIAGLRPDVIVTQALCAVCAVPETRAREVAVSLPRNAEVLSLTPSSLEDVFADIASVANALAVPDRGEKLLAELRERVAAVAERSAWVEQRPRVVLLEWLDPPFASGHWSPELVRLAGGDEQIGEEGVVSRTTSWEELCADHENRGRAHLCHRRAPLLQPAGPRSGRQPRDPGARAPSRAAPAPRRTARCSLPLSHDPAVQRMSAARVLLSWSSGKDSAWALHSLRQQAGVEVVGLLTTLNEAFGRVAMHGVPEALLDAQAKAALLPLWKVPLPWPCSNEQYEALMTDVIARARREGIQCIAFGDLYLEEIRAYRERQLRGTGIEPLFPIWGARSDTPTLAKRMIDSGVRAVLSCVDPKQLAPEFAGRVFDDTLLASLPTGVDPCGENGEFHTFCTAAPSFAQPLAVRVRGTETREGFCFADLEAA
jgi:uncharacterized protein (TIGR00290 family)